MLEYIFTGIRPECLPHFDQACWNLMEQCWAAEPSCRPLLGYVQPQLEAIMRISAAAGLLDSDTGKFDSSYYWSLSHSSIYPPRNHFSIISDVSANMNFMQFREF